MSPHAVYRMFARGGELLYVGCTNNPLKRFSNHPDWLLARTSRVTFEWHPDLDTGRAAETLAIGTENPALNCHDNPTWTPGLDGRKWRQSQVNRVTSGNLWCMRGMHRKPKRPTSTDQYAAMLNRLLRGYEKRVINDPAAALPHLRDIEQALADAANVGLYAAHLNGHSYTELAGMLGVTKQAIIKRAKLGETALRQREREAARKTRLELRKAAPRELASGQD